MKPPRAERTSHPARADRSSPNRTMISAAQSGRSNAAKTEAPCSTS
jgi:hypothetical protein